MIIDEHNQKAVEVFLEAADPEGIKSFWIGLTDLFHEGSFAWVTGEPVTYTNWAKGQPDNGGNLNEHFAVIWPVSHSRKWNDYFNDITGRFALCQFEL